MNNDANRQTGRTTHQMQEAPPNTVYVWCDAHLEYPKALAQALNRTDLVIIAPTGLLRLRGQNPACVILDHACVLTPAQVHAYAAFVMSKI